MLHSKDKLPQFFKYTNMGLQMLIVIVAGVYGGQYLDEYFENGSQVFTIILSLLSVFVSLYLALKDFIKPGKE